MVEGRDKDEAEHEESENEKNEKVEENKKRIIGGTGRRES